MGYINTRKVKNIKCDCSNCFHSVKTKRYSTDTDKTLFCNHFKVFNPKNKKCKRYYKKS